MYKPAKVAFCFTIAIVLSLCVARAQEAKPLPRHPGDTIKIEIKFGGPNADKFKSVDANFGLRGPLLKDQSGFRGGFGASVAVSSPGDTFRLEMKIPENIAT